MPKRRSSTVKKNINTNKNSVVVNINTNKTKQRRRTYPVRPPPYFPVSQSFPIAQNFPLANDVNGYINTVNRRNEVILDSIRVDQAKSASDALASAREPKQMVIPKSLLDDSDIEIYRSNAYSNTAPTAGRATIKVEAKPTIATKPEPSITSRENITLSSASLNSNRAPAVIKEEVPLETPKRLSSVKEEPLPLVNKPLSSLYSNTSATSGRNPSPSAQKSLKFDATSTPSGRVSSVSSLNNIRSVSETDSIRSVSGKNPMKRIATFLPSPMRDETSMNNFLSTTNLNQFTDFRDAYKAFKTYFESSKQPGPIPSSVRFKTEFNIKKKSNL